MMSCHRANPIFFNKKIKIGRLGNLPTPHPLRTITSHFCLNPPIPSKWTSYVYHPLNVLAQFFQVSFYTINYLRIQDSVKYLGWRFL